MPNLNVNLTEDKQQEYITNLETLLNTLNKSEPTLEGDGDLVTALTFLQLFMGQSILHLQRTYVLTAAIIDTLENKLGFVKAGSEFNGSSSIS